MKAENVVYEVHWVHSSSGKLSVAFSDDSDAKILAISLSRIKEVLLVELRKLTTTVDVELLQLEALLS